MLADLNKKKAALEFNMKEARLRHKEELEDFGRKIQQVNRDIALTLKDFNPEKAALAREWINVEHAYRYSYDNSWKTSFGKGETEQCLQDAIESFSKDPSCFDKQYIGCKDYDRWVGQHIGWTPNGMGPRHGSVCFRIEKVYKKRSEAIPPEAQEAVLWYLMQKVFMAEFEALKG